jgi:hypothetical protein
MYIIGTLARAGGLARTLTGTTAQAGMAAESPASAPRSRGSAVVPAVVAPPYHVETSRSGPIRPGARLTRSLTKRNYTTVIQVPAASQPGRRPVPLPHVLLVAVTGGNC